MPIDKQTLAIYLFFADSPIPLHREWVLKNIKENPDLAAMSCFQGFTIESPRRVEAKEIVKIQKTDEKQTEQALITALKMMDQCNKKAARLIRDNLKHGGRVKTMPVA